MKSYTVKGTNIRHNNKDYKPGAEIQLSDKDAARLKQYLKAKAAPKKPAGKGSGKPPAGGGSKGKSPENDENSGIPQGKPPAEKK